MSVAMATDTVPMSCVHTLDVTAFLEWKREQVEVKRMVRAFQSMRELYPSAPPVVTMSDVFAPVHRMEETDEAPVEETDEAPVVRSLDGIAPTQSKTFLGWRWIRDYEVK